MKSTIEIINSRYFTVIILALCNLMNLTKKVLNTKLGILYPGRIQIIKKKSVVSVILLKF